ncbi:transposase [Thermoleptolyngbya sp. M55_K2018_002]|uniref:transposase n=1 Tax=Thermoleptolyngbya sp. M55_K2018_002 TaxID=2747808 RepID=UPI001A0E1D93|nr:transposase [Thermoleptolyngbya sp. M55_K2018_002]HIK42735.1 transposase [Thermoleptolyngbya sp. M55_K2018_002]
MEPILVHAQALVYTLLNLMPSAHQKDSLQALLALFLEAQGHPLPQHSPIKSAGALSRFLNHYPWPTRRLIREVRQQLLQQLLRYSGRGRRPWLQLIVDLTTLEKCGKFKQFAPLISVLQGKRGLHLVVLYLVVGQLRVPWGFRVWRGKGSASSAQLAVRLIESVPKVLVQAFRVVVLADTAFGSVLFLKAMRKRRYPVIVGVRCDRKLADGRKVQDLASKGQQVVLEGLSFPVTISWLYLKRDGKLEKRFVLSTRPLKGSTITWWGRRRWSIEGFFKTIKHRFGLHRFGQQTLLGVYRWFVLCLISFILAHWAYLSTGSSHLPDWAEAAAAALQSLFPEVVVCLLLTKLERHRELLRSVGFDLQLVAGKT